jgi:hypothetical protein
MAAHCTFATCNVQQSPEGGCTLHVARLNRFLNRGTLDFLEPVKCLE